MYYFMDSGPKFTGLVWLNAGGIARDHLSFRFLISVSFRRYSRSKSEVVKNRSKFCMFLAPKFFRGGPPEFLDLDYLIGVDIDHVESFVAIGRGSSEILWLIKK